MYKRILITGGAGFIGSHLVRRFVRRYPDSLIVNLDVLSYAGNLENLRDIENFSNYRFVHADIQNRDVLAQLFQQYDFDAVVHLAAESHVDRSIVDPLHTAKVNLMGSLTLLDVTKDAWIGKFANRRYYQVSTDEVYGALDESGLFTESTPYNPQSPYSAAKASADHFARSYANTYGLPVLISCCSNNYGPNQFPEKLIPLCVLNMRDGQPVPVYGTGSNVRDWLYVEDHVDAIDTILYAGKLGETYNVGGANEWSNLALVEQIADIVDRQLTRPVGTARKLIRFVPDRRGHDFRYAIDSSKLQRELGWRPRCKFQEGLWNTVSWYLQHPQWTENVLNGEYRSYYARHYGNID